MKKALVLIFAIVLLLLPSITRADQLDEVTRELEQVKKLFLDINQANQTNQTTLNKLNQQLDSIKEKVAVIEKEIEKKKKDVEEGEKALVYQKQLLNERAINYYKNSSKNISSLINLLVADNFSVSLQNFFYQKFLLDEDKKTIIKIVRYIKNLEDKREELESEQTKMLAIKQEVDKQSQFLSNEVAKAKKYLGELQSKIAQLSARQQQLVAQKLAGLNISRSASSMGRCDSDLTNGRDPGFSPKFGFFTYGVPNRVGLNQYGAKGRSSFQGHEDILRAYYNNISFETRSNINIKVQGYNEMPIETYLLGIYEMPEDWPIEALKAQVIAARSYALAYTNSGAGEICTTESCQVYHQPEKTGQWKTAVQETSGKVMVQDGNPIKAWYSSTHGGYVHESGGDINQRPWLKNAADTSSGINSFSDLNNNAYDKESPWFYCDWGSRGDYNKTAWLKPSEVADIVNTILLVKRDSSTGEHLYQQDKPNPAGTDTWDAEKVKSELRSRGINPFSSINDVSVSADFGSGRTTSVNISGDAGSTSIDAGEFKNFFNLRAPANIQIVGPLYNVEKR